MPATVKITKRSTMQEVLEAYTRLRGTRFWGADIERVRSAVSHAAGCHE